MTTTLRLTLCIGFKVYLSAIVDIEHSTLCRQKSTWVFMSTLNTGLYVDRKVLEYLCRHWTHHSMSTEKYLSIYVDIEHRTLCLQKSTWVFISTLNTALFVDRKVLEYLCRHWTRHSMLTEKCLGQHCLL